jgi:HK97 gp10 family phage protein
MSVTVKVEGLSELKSAFEQLPKATGEGVLRKVLLARAEPIAAAAKALVAVESGELRDSIVASTRLSKSQAREAKETASYVEVYVGAGPLPHAHLVEFGSVNNQPQPYLRPAWDSAKGALLDNFKEDLWSEIEKAVGKLAQNAANGGEG